MNPGQNPTEQAHRNLKGVLLNGRILVNGLPLTANELSGVLQAEQLLYEKATKPEKAEPPQGNVIPIKADKKKKE